MKGSGLIESGGRSTKKTVSPPHPILWHRSTGIDARRGRPFIELSPACTPQFLSIWPTNGTTRRCRIGRATLMSLTSALGSILTALETCISTICFYTAPSPNWVASSKTSSSMPRTNAKTVSSKSPSKTLPSSRQSAQRTLIEPSLGATPSPKLSMK